MKTNQIVKNYLLDALMIILVPVLIYFALLADSFRVEEANGKFLLALLLTIGTAAGIVKLYSRYINFLPKK